MPKSRFGWSQERLRTEIAEGKANPWRRSCAGPVRVGPHEAARPRMGLPRDARPGARIPTALGADRDLRLGRRESPMLFGNRRPRKLDARRRHGGASAYRPQGERLENKLLLAIDLGGTTPPATPIIAAAPFGFDFAGGPTSTGATTPGDGWSVANVGDV